MKPDHEGWFWFSSMNGKFRPALVNKDEFGGYEFQPFGADSWYSVSYTSEDQWGGEISEGLPAKMFVPGDGAWFDINRFGYGAFYPEIPDKMVENGRICRQGTPEPAGRFLYLGDWKDARWKKENGIWIQR